MQEVARREMPSENNQEDGKYFAYNIFLHASQRNLDVMGFERRWKEMFPSGGTTRWILSAVIKGCPECLVTSEVFLVEETIVWLPLFLTFCIG